MEWLGKGANFMGETLENATNVYIGTLKQYCLVQISSVSLKFSEI